MVALPRWMAIAIWLVSPCSISNWASPSAWEAILAMNWVASEPKARGRQRLSGSYATGGRLRQVYHANTQRKALKTSGKGARIRTLVILRGHPFGKATVLDSFSSQAGASFRSRTLAGRSRGYGAQKNRVARPPRSLLKNDAPCSSGSIAQGLPRQHAEESLQNPLQRGQTPHLDLHFREDSTGTCTCSGSGVVALARCLKTTIDHSSDEV